MQKPFFFSLVDYAYIILKSCNGERKKVLHPRLRSSCKRSKWRHNLLPWSCHNNRSHWIFFICCYTFVVKQTLWTLRGYRALQAACWTTFTTQLQETMRLRRRIVPGMRQFVKEWWSLIFQQTTTSHLRYPMPEPWLKRCVFPPPPASVFCFFLSFLFSNRWLVLTLI